jgi:hypothetical protein
MTNSSMVFKSLKVMNAVSIVIVYFPLISLRHSLISGIFIAVVQVADFNLAVVRRMTCVAT